MSFRFNHVNRSLRGVPFIPPEAPRRVGIYKVFINEGDRPGRWVTTTETGDVLPEYRIRQLMLESERSPDDVRMLFLHEEILRRREARNKPRDNIFATADRYVRMHNARVYQ